MFSKILLASSTLSAIALAQSMGSSTVCNQTPELIYFQLVGFQGLFESGEIPPGGGCHDISYKSNIPYPRNQVTMKMGTTAALPNPYQFQFHLDNKGNVFYPFSGVTGDPFVNYFRSIEPSTPCAEFQCQPGQDSSQCEFTNPTNGPIGECLATSSLTVQIGP